MCFIAINIRLQVALVAATTKSNFINLNTSNIKWNALRNSVPLIQLKKRENTHAGVLRLVLLQVKA